MKVGIFRKEGQLKAGGLMLLRCGLPDRLP